MLWIILAAWYITVQFSQQRGAKTTIPIVDALLRPKVAEGNGDYAKINATKEKTTIRKTGQALS